MELALVNNSNNNIIESNTATNSLKRIGSKILSLNQDLQHLKVLMPNKRLEIEWLQREVIDDYYLGQFKLQEPKFEERGGLP